ncbi:beta-galactosidase [candidate division KSB1 bacterium]|nr:beta-galactosidase [candidate division KSB1 bacterium]
MLQKKIIAFLLILTIGSLHGQDRKIDLAGTWQFQMDPADKGIIEKWYLNPLAEAVQLPGCMAENNKGEDISVNTTWTGDILDRSFFTEPAYEKYRQPGNVKMPCWLTPDKHYEGAAWYQKMVEIPKDWAGKYIELSMERVHWESQVWVDDKPVGIQNSLATAHVYDLSSYLKPGQHRLTICVDNRMKEINIGPNSHSVSDHTQGNWNGIVGEMVLQAKSPVYLKDIKIFPDLTSKTAKVKLLISNTGGKTQKGKVILTATSLSKKITQNLPSISIDFTASEKETNLEVDYLMGDDILLWDEFQPNLYKMQVKLQTNPKFFDDSREIQFGMREFKTQGTNFTINGRKTFLRGTLECCIFPKTGYPPTDVESWLRIYQVCRNYGLNHIRFHSHCPPEAAFDAADRMGIYLHVECSSWANQGSTLGDGKPIDQFIFDESEWIVNAYGNHPSFCILLYGNEPAGDRQQEFLSRFIKHWQTKDTRRLYSSGAGWPIMVETDFHSTPGPRIQQWGQGLNSIINGKPPQTIFDFQDQIDKSKPTISHEIGQWCVYPNFKEIEKYTGYLKAKNFEIFQETLQNNQMGHLAEKFLLASGKLQTLCYKADIEAALRTEGFGGFQLLDLHDFPGQGTALVGVVDAFWDDKGYVTGKEFSQFCNSTVPLARLEKRYFLNNEQFTAPIEVAHYGEKELEAVVPDWRITDSNNQLLFSGKLPARNIPLGNCIQLGKIDVPLNTISTASKLTLEVSLAGFTNNWDFWVYPKILPELKASDLLLTSEINEKVVNHLKKGGKVLYSLPKGSLSPERGGNIALGFSSIFWNTSWTSKQPPHTLGILCDPAHAALAEFPTEYHSNWQWWDPIFHGNAILLDSLPASIDPIVRVIDDWFTNRRLALAFEANVLNGKMIVCSVDLFENMENRPVSRQLLYSLKKYMGSVAFNPSVNLTIADIEAFSLPLK